MLHRVIHVACIGIFYKIATDKEFPITMEKPVLSGEMFKCNRQNIFAAVTLTAESNEKGGQSHNNAITIENMHGP